MQDSAPESFSNVVVVTKANVYFDGKVVSHTVLFADGAKKTLGLIYPGSFHFGTDHPELMQISAGSCSVRLDGSEAWQSFAAGTAFRVPGKSGFDIKVESGIAEYVCSFE
jgi:purine/pyrimidine-nucleoside phosphorylase